MVTPKRKEDEEIKEESKKTDENNTNEVSASDIIGEVSRVRLNDDQLEVLENLLSKKVPIPQREKRESKNPIIEEEIKKTTTEENIENDNKSEQTNEKDVETDNSLVDKTPSEVDNDVEKKNQI